MEFQEIDPRPFEDALLTNRRLSYPQQELTESVDRLNGNNHVEGSIIIVGDLQPHRNSSNNVSETGDEVEFQQEVNDKGSSALDLGAKMGKPRIASAEERLAHLKSLEENRQKIKELLTKTDFESSRGHLDELFKSYSFDCTLGTLGSIPEENDNLKLPSVDSKSPVDSNNGDTFMSKSFPGNLNQNISIMAATHAGTPNSNMATPSRGVSRLGMMQARLQEQLMVEKESRLLEMAARQEAERDSTIQRVTKSSASSLSSSLSSLSMTTTLSGQGKVRKMFEDRRSTGYDKSYPLNPVKPGGPRGGPSKGVVRNNNNRGNSTERSGPGSYGGGYGQQQRSKSQAAPRGTAVRQPPLNRQNNNVNRSHHKSNPSLLDVNGGSNNNNNSAPGRFGAGRRSSNSPSVNGTSIGRGPSPAPPRREAPSPRKPSPSPFKSKSAPSRAQKSPAPFKSSKPKAPASLAPSPMPRSGSSASNAPPAPRTVPPGMAQCPICERCFNPDRIDKHTEICKKSQAKAKKRKVFDPVKMRNQGLETEKYVARGAHLKDVKPKKKDWRKQHQDFIATVRAAKGVKGYEAPPVDTSDYIQCPHCGRNFSEAAADRHIPKCSNIKSNKPTNKRR